MNDNIKVLISFGAAGGGFELAWALKQDLEEVLGTETTYLDAISLSGDPYTNYTWDVQLGIWKMSNDHWFAHYVDAMFNSKVMIFILTKEWLNSYYCWEEYCLFLQSRGITHIFLLDAEAMQMLAQGGEKVLRNDNGGELYQHLTAFGEYVKNSMFFILERSEETSEYVWVINNDIRYTYHTKYCLSPEERANLINRVAEIIFQ